MLCRALWRCRCLSWTLTALSADSSSRCGVVSRCAPARRPALTLLPVWALQATAFGMGGWWLGGGHMVPNSNFMAEVQVRPTLLLWTLRICSKLQGGMPDPRSRERCTWGRATDRPFLLQAKIPRDAKVVVACQKGLRSLAAAEQLGRAGYASLAWVNGGLDTTKARGSCHAVPGALRPPAPAHWRLSI